MVLDMSQINKFVAFKALIALIQRDEKEYLLEEAYDECLAQNKQPMEYIKNGIQKLYDLYSYEEISLKIGEMLTPKTLVFLWRLFFKPWKVCIKPFLTIRGIGIFPEYTRLPGGNRVVNRAFINFMEKKDVRAY
jgi:amidophosphoribosyltransferase